MIVAQRKNIPELLDIVEKHRKVLLLGCGTCVTVCLAGGQREVGIIASALRMAAKLKGRPLEVEELTIERQCDNVFLEQAADAIKRNDAVLSVGCGAGVQAIAERYSNKPVYAGLNTAFIGILEERGVWTEKCAACGECVLHLYGGICPITRCAKKMMNGPCSGSREDRCEVSPDRPCAWQLIYTRLKEIGQLDRLKELKKPKNWRQVSQVVPQNSSRRSPGVVLPPRGAKSTKGTARSLLRAAFFCNNSPLKARARMAGSNPLLAHPGQPALERLDFGRRMDWMMRNIVSVLAQSVA